MAMGFSTAVRSDIATAIKDAIETGTTNTYGRLLIYEGTRPATGGAVGTLLATVDLDGTHSVTSGQLSFGNPSSVNAVATGTAEWARITDRDNTFIADLDIATSGSDVNLASTSLILNNPVDFVSGTITVGNT